MDGWLHCFWGMVRQNIIVEKCGEPTYSPYCGQEAPPSPNNFNNINKL
jgi:hypothetical protein